MRRSILLTVAVFCPHLNRTVAVERNEAIGRLVYCATGETCRQSAGQSVDPPGSEANRPYPASCPVYPSLTASS